MLDLELLRRDPETVTAALLKRVDHVDLDPILAADRTRREKQAVLDARRGERKRLGAEIGRLRASGADSAELQSAATALRDEIDALEADLDLIEGTLRDLQMELPNLPDSRVPAGGKDANQVVGVWGDKPEISTMRDHVELSTLNGLVDYERGTKLAGRGFWIYTGMGAALEWAVLDFMIREHLSDGYTFVLPPHILLEEVGYAAGQFPKFFDEVYHLERDPGERGLFLLPTSETAILSLHAGEILDAGQLPLRLFAYTPCYRQERAGHRSEERGTVRGHQFNKVEIFQFVSPDGAEAALGEIVRKAQSIVEKLGLHHRTSLLAARDASASMAITYDIEVWIPSMNTYKEVSSASYAGDYQARRANIRFRPPGSKRSQFVHTLNASALATSRLVPALLEQNQQPDGSIVVPKALRAWLGVDVLRPAA